MSNERILIVEDELIVAENLKYSLKGMGYQVIDIVTRGETAIERSRELKPDLVLMDIMLKGEMTGIDAAEYIFKDLEIPVVFLSAYADDDTVSRAKITEPFGYIVKPYLDRDLHSTVEIAIYKHKMEMELRRSEEKYRLLVENANEGIAVIQNMCFKYLNEKALRITGYQRDELLENSYDIFIHPDDREIVVKRDEKRLLEEEAPPIYSFRIFTKDGILKWVETNAVKFNWEGKPATLNFFTDITERMKAKNALVEERDRAQGYLDVAGVIIVAINRDQEVTLINEKGCEILGYNQEEILGKNWFDHFIPELNGGSVKDVFNMIMNGEIEPVEYFENKVRTSSGDTKIIAWHNTVLRDENGLITETLSSGLDITEERKKAEELKKVEEERLLLEAQVRQKQKLESVGTLASGVAHEINNPLMGIINYAQLIHDRINRDDLKGFSKGIIIEGERVARIVKNLLSFSRQNQNMIDPAQIDEIIDSSLNLIGSLMRKDQITVKLDIPSGLPDIVCNAQQIQQVIMNLLTNARDALNEKFNGYHDDKVILISIQRLVKDGKDTLRTTIEDHGVGIPENIGGRIMDPFFTTKSRAVHEGSEGTGLGLSISYGIIADHDGELWFESKEGRFSRFHIDLPAVSREMIMETPWEKNVDPVFDGSQDKRKGPMDR